jgi:colicin import membrane protein
MSTVSKSRSSKPPKPPKPPKPELDPYRYGWREVTVKSADGTETSDAVPLTEEDVLFPEVGDFIVQSTCHNSDVQYFGYVCEARLAGEPAAVVISDCLVDWNLRGVRPLGPDIAVFFGVERVDEGWETFDVAAEGAEPALVVEVTSRSTRKNDLGPKVKFYQRAKVPFYLIADATGLGAKRRITLIGRRYTARGYKEVQPDDQGRIHLEALGLLVGVTRDRPGDGDRLACYDPVTGAELGNYTAVVEALAAAEARERAAQRTARAEARRADAEARRADAEAQARAAAEKRIRELEAELKRSRRPGR